MVQGRTRGMLPPPPTHAAFLRPLPWEPTTTSMALLHRLFLAVIPKLLSGLDYDKKGARQWLCSGALATGSHCPRRMLGCCHPYPGKASASMVLLHWLFPPVHIQTSLRYHCC